jgi:hypothetical protein
VPDERGSVEIGLEQPATVVDGTLFSHRPPCTYIGLDNVQCRKPAHYEFGLSLASWPGTKPSPGQNVIKQFACQEHGYEARSMAGVVYVKTI